MTKRFAVYLAPPQTSALWRFGSHVLGRDAATGEATHAFAPEGFTLDAWRELTAEPRRYGFHATLKAPFRLIEGRSQGELEEAIAGLAASVEAFDAGSLQLAALSFTAGVFAALTPVQPPTALIELERRAVRDLDSFRAPPSPAELQRRRPDRLSPRQRDYLSAWGYPYVLDEFRLHFTLTGPLTSPEGVVARLRESYAASVPDNRFRVDALALFVQEAGGDFLLVRRFRLKNAAR